MAKRKYQLIWEYLKKKPKEVLKVSIDGIENFTEEEILRRFNTIRKAVKKEKYKDNSFKYYYPNSELQFTLERDVKTRKYTGVIEVELDLDRKDLSGILQ